MKRISVLTLVMLCMTLLGQSQTTEEFKPGGKPFMTIFSNYHTKVSDGNSASAFELTRLYLGYDYKFSKNFSAKATIDIGDPGVGGLQMTAYVKNAFATYKLDKLSVNFGLISTTQFKVQEDAWGYRYLAKSFQDEYKFNASADLGISVAYKFSDFVSADVIVANGEGYKKLQADSVVRTGFGVTVSPVEKLTGRVYYDFSSKEQTLSSLATFVGYAGDKFSVGAEYNQQFNNGFKENHDLNGASVYATVTASKKVKVFGRYDNLSSNKLTGETEKWNLSKNGELFIAGVEYAPVKGVKVAPNFQGWSPAAGSQDFTSTFILNCEFKF
ncbi:porin [Gaoshiqia sediminis]|uniref:Porin n=1 Tax=Gaoshiqia sediminis TaxID=2986998 RepID=A0AA42C7B4_9BACT|nr:porin [Gaoshiqia sediminis]MCW0484818.1 porin [Gaoshiqia sediminis]